MKLTAANKNPGNVFSGVDKCMVVLLHDITQ